METIVEVEDLSKVFPVANKFKVHAVEHVSLHIAKAETLAVVGESGCGKSTLAFLIIRLLESTGGRIMLGSVDITNLRTRDLRPHRRKMQIIFQDPLRQPRPTQERGQRRRRTVARSQHHVKG